jgi:TfoX/Sxy family transcriptional regulator of competence genes
MAYDESLAERVRDALIAEGAPTVTEKKMFGGLCFLLGGNMTLGITKDQLMTRFDPARHDEMLARPGARPMDFTKTAMRGMAFVGPEALVDDADLRSWVRDCLAFGRALPPKAPKAPKSASGARKKKA